MEISKKKLIEFIVEERKLKQGDDRHTDLFTNGFVSACNIILDFVHDAKCVEDVE